MKIRLLQILIALTCLDTFADITPAPEICKCQWASKDYDPSKGYFMDKIEKLKLSKRGRYSISGKFACIYSCADSKGHTSQVSYVHSETHHSWFKPEKGGYTNAKLFHCERANRGLREINDGSDIYGKSKYYEAIDPSYNFDPNRSKKPEFIKWVKESGCSPNSPPSSTSQPATSGPAENQDPAK
ncbi:MAG: hypothetical protein ACAH59_02565 [Pseudobdellovibrionaceae bacterium]